MTSFLIPTSNEELFLKKVKRFIKKANGGIQVVPTNDYDFIDYVTQEGNTIKVKGRWYNVEGTYKLNGWVLVGEIEHKENGNVIRIIEQDYSDEATSLYKNAPSKCDHCGTIRVRNNTFIVYNENTKEFKQVGKNCLMDYTGFDVERCAAMASIITLAKDFEAPCEERVSSGSKYLNNEIYRKICYDYISKKGYNKEVAKIETIDAYFRYFKDSANDMGRNVSEECLSEVAKWIENASSTNPSNAYYQSCKVIWTSDYIECRDVNYQLSMLSNYFREREDANRVSNEYVGQVGDRVDIELGSRARVLYEKGRYSFYGPEVCLVELIDKDGHTFIWSTSNYYLEEGTKIRATIKGYKEYKGVKQTIITRGTIIEEPKSF